MKNHVCKRCCKQFQSPATKKPYCSLPCALWSRVSVRGEDECWPWVGATAKQGYGNFGYDGVTYAAHRAVLVEVSGVVGDYACHECDNPPCCNPGHLYWGTPTDNYSDMRDRGRWRPAKHPKAVPDDVVRQVRSLIGLGRTNREIADALGVRLQLGADIRAGRKYRGVE